MTAPEEVTRSRGSRSCVSCENEEKAGFRGRRPCRAGEGCGSGQGQTHGLPRAQPGLSSGVSRDAQHTGQRGGTKEAAKVRMCPSPRGDPSTAAGVQVLYRVSQPLRDTASQLKIHPLTSPVQNRLHQGDGWAVPGRAELRAQRTGRWRPGRRRHLSQHVPERHLARREAQVPP